MKSCRFIAVLITSLLMLVFVSTAYAQESIVIDDESTIYGTDNYVFVSDIYIENSRTRKADGKLYARYNSTIGYLDVSIEFSGVPLMSSAYVTFSITGSGSDSWLGTVTAYVPGSVLTVYTSRYVGTGILHGYFDIYTVGTIYTVGPVYNTQGGGRYTF